MLEKEFIPYQESLELAKLGFNEPCSATRDQIDFLHIKGSKKLPRGSMLYDTVDCPTFSQVFRFFREKYGIEPQVKSWKERGNIVWYYSVQLIGEPSIFRSADCCVSSYEEAELKCLRKLIEIVKSEL